MLVHGHEAAPGNFARVLLQMSIVDSGPCILNVNLRLKYENYIPGFHMLSVPQPYLWKAREG